MNITLQIILIGAVFTRRKLTLASLSVIIEIRSVKSHFKRRKHK